MAYKRPQTIATLLTNYEIQAHEDNVTIGRSYTYGNFFFIQPRGRKRNGEKTNLIKLKSGKTIEL